MSKETKKLLIFFLATFVWTWAFYAPIAIGGHNPYQMPWMILLILGGMGPSLVGVVMVMLSRDREARRDFWRRSFSFKRVHAAWWAVIFLLFPILYGISILVDLALGGSLPGMALLKDLIANPLMIPLAAFISFMSGPFSEEFGWRGYAEDRIISPLGIVTGTIVLGLIWGIWHLPLFFMSDTWHGQIGFGLSGLWMFMLHSVGLSLLMTWVYLNTNRSILSGMFMHFTSNFTGQLLAPVSEQVDLVKSVLMLVIGLTVCLLLSRRDQKLLQMNPPTAKAS
jgi:membrane protease YdiL (CAAX protease family)